MDSSHQLQAQIHDTENHIVAAEAAEREGYQRLAHLRQQLALTIIADTPFTPEAIDVASAAEAISAAWSQLIHHRWQASRSRSFTACPGWVFRASSGTDPSKLEVSLEPAELDERDELVGMPSACKPVHRETVHTLSPVAIHQLDAHDLTRALNRLVNRTKTGPAHPTQREQLGVIDTPPGRIGLGA